MSLSSFQTLVSCVLFLSIAHIAVGQRCSRAHVQICMEPLEKFDQNQAFEFLGDGKNLKETCREIQSAMDCLETYLRDCVKGQEQMKLRMNKLMAGLREYITNICDENSQEHRDALQYGECVSKAIKNEVCSSNMKKSMESVGRTAKDQSEVTEAVCCAINRHYVCIKGLFVSQCGEGAGRIVDSRVKLAYNAASIKTAGGNCALENGVPKCSSAFTVRPASILLAFAAIFWACQRKFW